MVPVTVVTGAVGAGKSTLLHRVLAAAKQERVAVVQMRFAVEIGCEESLELGSLASVVERDDAFETLEHLCMCCNPREELEIVLEGLASRESERFDRLVIETTGLADPACLWPLLALRETFRVDSVVCVVSAELFDSLPKLSSSGLRSIEHEQVAAASVVAVVNCGDQRKLKETERQVRAIEPLIQGRLVTSDDALISDAVLRPGMWSFDEVMGKEPDYFSEHTPYRRHQDRLACSSLVGVYPMTDEQLEACLSWLSTQSWMRLKGRLHRLDGSRVLLDGFRGTLHRAVMSPQTEPGDSPCHKIALVGETDCLPSSAQLQRELEAHCRVKLQPTVLYSAPPPPVDTTTQRVVLAAAAAVSAVAPVSSSVRVWTLAFLAVYFALSTWKSWGRR